MGLREGQQILWLPSAYALSYTNDATFRCQAFCLAAVKSFAGSSSCLSPAPLLTNPTPPLHVIRGGTVQCNPVPSIRITSYKLKKAQTWLLRSKRVSCGPPVLSCMPPALHCASSPSLHLPSTLIKKPAN